jgi:glycogen operon protein
MASASGSAVLSAASRGTSYPLGATPVHGGVNFSLFSRHATAVELLLFDGVDDAAPSRVIELTSREHRTYFYWHACVPDIGPGQCYGYRVHGPFDPARGFRFDPKKLLLDPYGRCIARPKGRSREAARQPFDNAATAFKSVVADVGSYDWEDDAAPRMPFARTVIYEMHVRGFTRHPSSGVASATRGTYAGVIDKIPYLQDLGVTAVELLPVFAFDEQAAPRGVINYWGYQPVSFFAPHDLYCSRPEPLAALDEFRDMVKALHRAGLEVILDVVYNHTAEGGADGPTYCWRGLANGTYYILKQDKSEYADFAGCGNTINANNPIARRMILDSLRYWVSEMHVDGFRFDLASILSRDEEGHPMASPPLVWDIESDPVLAHVKLIAEAWDAGGLYQVGTFVGDAWTEWNGRFRDDVRAFMKGNRQTVRALASRLVGSPDLYARQEREPERTINFVTCHDGFTLNDLVSYNRKHNEANGERNRDGSDDNLSWNCGAEGPTADPDIEKLRNRQVKNFLALTLLGIGTPMLLMGDEARRTQLGNNNAYCHDNETTWFDWGLLEKHADVRRFARALVALRVNRALSTQRFGMTLNDLLRHPHEWHGVALDAPDWGDDSHTLALTVRLPGERVLLHLVVNAYWEPLSFAIPPTNGDAPWRRMIDTFLESPDDITDWRRAALVQDTQYLVQPRSIVLLARPTR